MRTTMEKTFYVLCLLSVFICVHLDGVVAKVLKKEAKEFHGDCPLGVPPSGRRIDPSFPRSQRTIGLVSQPRIGRSDPLMQMSEPTFARTHEETGWLESDPDYGHSTAISLYNQHRDFKNQIMSGEKEENLRNLENYLSAQRRESNSPWAFFLITPNFYTGDQSPQMDNLKPSQYGQDINDLNGE